MLSRCLLVFILGTCHCQYQVDTGVRADITFDDRNDRFDVGAIIKEQNRMFQDMPTAMEQGYRRNFPSLSEILKNERRRYQQGRKKSLRRTINDFAYHDQMLDKNDFNEEQYEKTLQNYRRQKPSRRNNKQVKTLSKKVNRDEDNADMKGLQAVVLNYLHGGKELKSARRMNMPENEILLHHAVPLRMKVKGFLEMPRDAVA